MKKKVLRENNNEMRVKGERREEGKLAEGDKTIFMKACEL